jgi:ElaB/YqjD/DUF883 family membrane-anchored ribosome-binding protein
MTFMDCHAFFIKIFATTIRNTQINKGINIMSYFNKNENNTNSEPTKGDIVVENLNKTKESIAEATHNAAHNAGEKVRNMYNCVSDEISGASCAVSSQIKNKPMQSGLIVLGVGFILGALLRR